MLERDQRRCRCRRVRRSAAVARCGAGVRPSSCACVAPRVARAALDAQRRGRASILQDSAESAAGRSLRHVRRADERAFVARRARASRRAPRARRDRARSRARRAAARVGSNATPRAISTRRCSPRDSSRKLARGELRDAEPSQHAERSLALAGRRPAARHVGAIDARQHDVERREIPAQPRVAILELVAHEHDLAARAHGVGLFAGAEVVAARSPRSRRRPERARDQAEQRALAAAVRADDAPVLAARETPRDVAQHGARRRDRRRRDRE